MLKKKYFMLKKVLSKRIKHGSHVRYIWEIWQNMAALVVNIRAICSGQIERY